MSIDALQFEHLKKGLSTVCAHILAWFYRGLVPDGRDHLRCGDNFDDSDDQYDEE